MIDGRQRFETLKKFLNNEIKLSKKGLTSLTELAGSHFKKLDEKIQEIFLDTTIRVIEFSFVGEHEQKEEIEDLIKKEIFWRYNSGITPLKNAEVQQAKYLDDGLTGFS